MPELSRPARGPAAPARARRRARRGFRPEPLTLEGRRLLAAVPSPFQQPTDGEQYLLELVNRARANPPAEGERLVALAQTDPVLRVATAGEDLGQFLRVIASYGPEPPLALDPRLNEAASDWSLVMLALNTQFHSPPGYLTNPAVAHATDGQAFFPVGPSWWATGENVFAYSGNVGGSGVADYAYYFEAAFLLDWGNPDFGHLKNLLAPGPGSWSPGTQPYPFNVVGIGLLTGVTPTVPPGSSNPIAANQGLNVGPDIVTQEFGFRSGAAYLTGSFYVDAAGTSFYAPGEGLGGVTVTAVGLNGQGAFQTQTRTTGGYSLPLPPGTYQVSATGALPYPLSTTVTIGADNVGWEYEFKPGPPHPASPVTAPVASTPVAAPAPAPTSTLPAPTVPAPTVPIAPHAPSRHARPTAPQPPAHRPSRPVVINTERHPTRSNANALARWARLHRI